MSGIGGAAGFKDAVEGNAAHNDDSADDGEPSHGLTIENGYQHRVHYRFQAAEQCHGGGRGVSGGKGEEDIGQTQLEDAQNHHDQQGAGGEIRLQRNEWAADQGISVDDIFDRYDGILEGSTIEAIQIREDWNAYSDNHAFTWAIIPIYYVPSPVQAVKASEALNGLDPTDVYGWGSIIHDQGLLTRWQKLTENHVPGTLLQMMTAEEESATTKLRGNLNVHFFNTRTAFQTGELDIYDDQVWQDYLDQLEAYGLSTVLKVYQIVYDRYLANLNG